MLFHLSPLDGGNVFHTLNNNTLKELQKSKKAVWFYYKFYKERLDTPGKLLHLRVLNNVIIGSWPFLTQTSQTY